VRAGPDREAPVPVGFEPTVHAQRLEGDLLLAVRAETQCVGDRRPAVRALHDVALGHALQATATREVGDRAPHAARAGGRGTYQAPKVEGDAGPRYDRLMN